MRLLLSFIVAATVAGLYVKLTEAPQPQPLSKIETNGDRWRRQCGGDQECVDRMALGAAFEKFRQRTR